MSSADIPDPESQDIEPGERDGSHARVKGMPPREAEQHPWVMTLLVPGSLKINSYKTALGHAGHPQDEEAENRMDVI